jgi:hypothetical protein
MKQLDVFQMMNWIDASLEMLRSYEGRLTGPEVRARSLLTLARQELARDLIEHTIPEKSDLLAD